MMWVSIMQPYLFPYIGYFQLMAACDTFIIFDDVQYIQRGWVNRNRVLVDGAPQWITLPVAKADYFLPINQRDYLLHDRLAHKLRRRIIGAYAASPYFDNVMPVIDRILEYEDTNVAHFNTHQLKLISDYIGINTPVLISSSIDKDTSLKGQDLVIDVCRMVSATGYINPIGGIELYRSDCFSDFGLELRFLKSCAPEYEQFGGTYINSLSIIDVLMFNTPPDIKRMLTRYELIRGK